MQIPLVHYSPERAFRHQNSAEAFRVARITHERSSASTPAGTQMMAHAISISINTGVRTPAPAETAGATTASAKAGIAVTPPAADDSHAPASGSPHTASRPQRQTPQAVSSPPPSGPVPPRPAASGASVPPGPREARSAQPMRRSIGRPFCRLTS